MTAIERYSNPTQADVDAYVELPDGLIAHRYGILGTALVVYRVYQRTDGMPRNHSTITSTPGYGWMGDIQSERLPAELEALKPYSQERSTAVLAWFKELEAKAERIIRAAFPEDFAEEAQSCS